VTTLSATKKPESPTNAGIPASTPADYRGNFGLKAGKTPKITHTRREQRRAASNGADSTDILDVTDDQSDEAELQRSRWADSPPVAYSRSSPVAGPRSGSQGRGFVYVAAHGRGSGPLAHAAAAWAGNALLLDA
jgi:hypothetical protein